MGLWKNNRLACGHELSKHAARNEENLKDPPRHTGSDQGTSPIHHQPDPMTGKNHRHIIRRAFTWADKSLEVKVSGSIGVKGTPNYTFNIKQLLQFFYNIVLTGFRAM